MTDNQLSPIVWPLQSVVDGLFPCVGDLPTLHGPPDLATAGRGATEAGSSDRANGHNPATK
jgi:hypothetical protein